MEMEMESSAAAMDFNALSRRELQALCKLNGVRANMTNLAMVEALNSLPSVNGIDQIGTTLCLPTPGKSAMKSVLKATPAAGQDQQHGSPLPRSRRVSVMSPEAIRMDVEEGEDDEKRNLAKEIVRTPGVALRSSSRRPRATPEPLPTPAAGTLRRSQRSTRKTEKAMALGEVEASTAKRSTRKTARSKVTIDLDLEDEDSAALKEEEKVQEVQPMGVTSDEKCDDPEGEQEEVTKLPEEGNSKADEPEQREVVSSVAPIESADKCCDSSKLEEDVEEATKLQEAAVEEEQKLVSAEKSVPLSAMEDSPIFGVLSKATPEPAIKNVEVASTEDGQSGKWSPVLEIDEEINIGSEDKEVAAVEVPKEVINENVFNSTAEAADVPNKMIPAAVTEKEVVGDDFKEDALNSTVEAADAPKEDALNSTVEAADALNKMTPAAVTDKEVTADDFQEDAVNSTFEASDALDEMTLAAVIEKEVAADDLKKDAFNSTIEASDVLNEMTPAGVTEKAAEAADAPTKMIPAPVTEKEFAADDFKEDALVSTVESTDAPNKMIPAAVTEKEVTAEDLPQSDLTDDESSEEVGLDGESSEEADLTDGSSEEADLSEYSSDEDYLEEDLEDEDMQKASDSTDVNFDSDEEVDDLKMPEAGEKTKENEKSGEEDDFSTDLSSEFDNVELGDAETETDGSPVSPEEIHATAAAASSAVKTADSAITEELEESSEGGEVSQHIETIIEALDKVTSTKEKKEMFAKQNAALADMSLRKLKSAFKESLIAAKEGKKLVMAADEGSRVALAELDDNAEC